MNRMKPCHEGSPAGGANGVDVVVSQDDAPVRQGVDVRRRDLIGPVEPDIVPTLSRDQDNVRL